MAYCESTDTGATPQAREPLWWGVCRELYRQQHAVSEIAKHVKRSQASVRYAIGSEADREHRRAKGRERGKTRDRSRDADRPLPVGGAPRTSHEASFTEAYVPRQVARVIAAPEQVMEAARLFASGVISRQELSYLIRAGA